MHIDKGVGYHLYGGNYFDDVVFLAWREIYTITNYYVGMGNNRIYQIWHVLCGDYFKSDRGIQTKTGKEQSEDKTVKKKVET